jgi:NADH dehydrogenase
MMSALPQRIVVLGGSGFVGRALCERLVRAGDGGGSVSLIVPTRRAMHANSVRFLPGVDVRIADVHDDTALLRLLSGCDAVVNLVAILHGRPAEFNRVHAALPQRLARLCQQLGVRRIVHVSALGVASSGGTEPSMYLRSKSAGEAALRQGGLELTLLRPSVIFGAADRFMNLFAALQAVLPVMPLAGGDARFQPVWVEDVAEAIVRCLQRRETIDKIIECTGPDVFTLEQLVRAAGRWSGHERPILALPMALGRLQALAMELMPGIPLMSRDNLDSMKVPNIASGRHPGLDMLGIAAASLASVAPGYLGHSDGRARLDALRARAGRAAA